MNHDSRRRSARAIAIARTADDRARQIRLIALAALATALAAVAAAQFVAAI